MIFLLALTIYNISQTRFLNHDLYRVASLIIFLIMIDIYISFKVAKIVPKLTVFNANDQNLTDAFTFKALCMFLRYATTSSSIKGLLHEEQIKFLLIKADINKKEISLTDISKDDLLKKAFEIAKNLQGKQITTVDLVTAYLLLTEQTTKLLFNKKLKEEDILNIAYWTRNDFPDEENPKPRRVHFWGEGIGEDWVFGWTPEARKYVLDLTDQAVTQNPVLVGRNKEYQEAVELLSKSEKNNVLLVGEPGSGKTTLIQKIAFDSFIGNLKGNLYHRRFFELLAGSLLAGVNNQGDLEARLEEVLTELAHSGNIILFVPEIQNILGSTSYNLDLSGALLPYMQTGSMRIIATATVQEYKSIIEAKHTFLDFFGVIKLEEPSIPEAIQMLLEKAHVIETKNNVNITYKAIVAAVTLSKKFIQDRFLPGAAVVLLDDVASRVVIQKRRQVEEEDVLKLVEERAKIALSSPTTEEKELLLHLEDKLHERVIDQQEAISAISESLRRVRSGLTNNDKPISFLFLGPTGVGKTETAKALASLYFGGEDKIIRLDMSEYGEENGLERLLGSSMGNGGELIDKTRDHPFSLVLLDEFEKANQKILDVFLQVLDDGRLTDNRGKTVSFGSSIIIATSNAGAEFIREEIQKGSAVDKSFQQRLMDVLQKNAIFKPELLNRFDGVIVFKPLGENEAREITKLMLKGVSKKLLEQDINISFSNSVVDKIVKEGIDPQFGARPLSRFIQDNIEDLLAQKLLKGEIQRGNNFTVSVDSSNSIVITSS